MHTSCLNSVWGHNTVATVTASAVTDQSVRGVEVSAAFGGGMSAHMVDLLGVRLPSGSLSPRPRSESFPVVVSERIAPSASVSLSLPIRLC